MKSDFSVFSTYWIGLIIGLLGIGFGLIMLIGRKVITGIVIIIVFFFIAKYLMFKAKRRRGHVLYNGGNI